MKKLEAALASLILLVTMGTQIEGQVIRGRVTDGGNGAGLEDVPVRLISGESSAEAARTDSLGAFTINLTAPGTYRVSLQKSGYRPAASSPVRVEAGDTVYLPIALPLQVVLLDTVTMRAQRRRRTQMLLPYYKRLSDNAFGQFVTREDVDRMRPQRTSDLLSVIPGVRLIPASLGMMNTVLIRECVPVLFVDGVRVRGGGLDEYVLPGDVEGIEIYKSSAEAPVEFRGQNPGCGILLVWTRIEVRPRR